MGRHSDLVDLLRSANCSLLGTFESQVLGSPESLLLPSEPPDIRNWFSSYGYESPGLDTVVNESEDEGFTGGGVEENKGEIEGNFGGFGRPEKRDEVIADEKVASEELVTSANSPEINLESQVLGLLDSLLPLSEPSDIRNWFSSNADESPGLDTFVNDSEDERRDGFEERNNKKEENMGGFRRPGTMDGIVADGKVASKEFVTGANSAKNSNYESQFLASSDSTLSEPPDIKKWFSSYIYESPALDTSEAFGFYATKGSNADKEGCNADKITGKKTNLIQDGSRRRDDMVGRAKNCTEFVKCSSSGIDNKYEDQYVSKDNHEFKCDNSSVTNYLPFKRMSEETLARERAQNNDYSSINDTEKPGLSIGDSTRKIEKKIHQEANHRRLVINKSSNDRNEKSMERLIQRKHSVGKISTAEAQKASDGIVSPGTNFHLDVMNSSPLKKVRSSGKENDGFVSTRASKRVKNENSVQRPVWVQSTGLRNGETVSSVGNNESIIRRNVLSERTNFQQSDLLGISGKWRCPQKRKPTLGPPLEQLGLERWVLRL